MWVNFAQCWILKKKKFTLQIGIRKKEVVSVGVGVIEIITTHPSIHTNKFLE